MKRGMINREIIIILIIIMTLGIVQAHLGIRPALVELNYNPGDEATITYYVDTTPGTPIRIYAFGDMNETVTFDNTEFLGSGGFNAKIKLPPTAQKPGPNHLFIRAEQVVSEGSGLGTSITVGALIKIHVPYPGKYAEMDFEVSNANKGEPVEATIKATNKGKEPLEIKAELSIYNSEGTELLAEYDLGTQHLEPTQEYTYKKNIATNNYLAGIYKAVGRISYSGEERIIEKEFRIGQLNVEILNSTREVKEKTINPYTINIQSEWKNVIEGVYAEIGVINKTKEVMRFSTPPITLEGFQQYELKGFLDATELTRGEYESNITIHYSGKTTRTKIPLTIIKKDGNKTTLIIIAIAIFTILLLITIIIRIIKRKKNKKVQSQQTDKVSSKPRTGNRNELQGKNQ